MQTLTILATFILLALSPMTSSMNEIVKEQAIAAEYRVEQRNIAMEQKLKEQKEKESKTEESADKEEIEVSESTEEDPEPVISTTKADIELLALVTMAEAEGESEYGKRLVIDTILNRVDHPLFPNTISGVIYEPSQFSSMWNGRVDKCYVRADIYKLVEQELKNRQNYDVIFFTAGRYSNYGTRLFSVGNHYFSSY